MMEERGLFIVHTTIMRWVHQYGPELDERVRGIILSQPMILGESMRRVCCILIRTLKEVAFYLGHITDNSKKVTVWGTTSIPNTNTFIEKQKLISPTLRSHQLHYYIFSGRNLSKFIYSHPNGEMCGNNLL
jgi:hypothetical protein